MGLNNNLVKRGKLLYQEKDLSERKKEKMKWKFFCLTISILALILLLGVILGLAYNKISLNIGSGLGLMGSFIIAIIGIYLVNKIRDIEIYEKGIIFPIYPILDRKDAFIPWSNINQIYLNERNSLPFITIILNSNKGKKNAFYVPKKHIVNFLKFTEYIKDKTKIITDVDAKITSGGIREFN